MDFGNDRTEIERPSLPDPNGLDALFEAPAAIPDNRPSIETKTLGDISICPSCDCEMVYPIDWARAESNRWQVTLRCPNCERVDSGVFNEDLIERYDCLLDRGTDSLVRDLRNLTYANMATEISAFVDALQSDFVLPEDF